MVKSFHLRGPTGGKIAPPSRATALELSPHLPLHTLSKAQSLAADLEQYQGAIAFWRRLIGDCDGDGELHNGSGQDTS